jgi:predicted RNA polymerase sigma factor
VHARRFLLEQVFRDEWGRVLASLIGFLGDFDIAEEAAQEAFAIAAKALAPRGALRAGRCTGIMSESEGDCEGA